MDKYTEPMTQDFIKSTLIAGIVQVEFLKADGSLRKMNATLNESIIPKIKEDATKEKKVNPDICIIWDTDANAWRSFRWDRLQEVKEIAWARKKKLIHLKEQ
jgi:hypothetical protein|tara:strand:- start:231 stop:536 length:306 start_codon:yes stop_codon:yes gene_type:complete